MECMSPIHVPDKRFDGVYHTVPCGKCPACVQNRASQWYVRLKMESKLAENAVFVTLSYATDYLPPYRFDENGFPHFDVSRSDLQHYHYRLRKSLGSRSKKLKYFAVAEYGPNPGNGWLYRPHYHILYFNLKPEDYVHVENSWKKGNIEFGEILDERLRYVSGYSTEKLFSPPGALPPFSCISKGIGKVYIDSFKSFHVGQEDRFFCPIEGKRFPMPRYYKERLYTPTERAKFARKMEQKAEERFQKDLHACNGNLDVLQSIYHDQRVNTIQALKRKHKKKQTI